MNESMIGHELDAMERQGMLDKIANLKSQLAAMESDFARCAIGISPCFFCANDDTCTGTTEKCKFKWNKHN